MTPYILKPHLVRTSEKMELTDERVPKALSEIKSEAPDLTGFPYPLPSRKCDYTCFAEGHNGVIWYGAKDGITRYDKNAEAEEDIIMYFSPLRHIPYGETKALLPDGNGVWAAVGDKAVHIELTLMTCEEKDALLREETDKYVMRRGMVSHMELAEPGKIESAVGYTSCDNDGLFTSCHALGEMFRYATLRRERGENDSETKKARQAATAACEASLLLTYIHGRDEGFIARSYHLPHEPLPNDGVFYKRNGNTAVCVFTDYAEEKGFVGETVPCGHPIPERLRHFFTDGGFTEDDITYKADTSSDEITGHFLQMRYAHDILGPDDPELDEIIKDACRRTTGHIIDGGFEFREATGRSTTWARWSKKYFTQERTGYVDAPLNASEMLLFLKLTMYITGEKGIWQETYDSLLKEGYADLAAKHPERAFIGAADCGCSVEEDLMYGDHMLVLATYWQLIDLETDTELLEKYRAGFRSWKRTLLREHMPGYDFPYIISMPDEDIDIEKDALWLYRMEPSRVAAAVNLCRHDVPVQISRHGLGESLEISSVLMPDERFIRKYDHNPFQLIVENNNNGVRAEGSYVFTLAYWYGRYNGIIAEEK